MPNRKYKFGYESSEASNKESRKKLENNEDQNKSHARETKRHNKDTLQLQLLEGKPRRIKHKK
ncbi:hypothetical protein C922_05096 [Plasmodium inui San Antonio 1]|uniref:Uncharacterized protein n=1 Tax=Plasmodium inui San Antonio 1 TaxID=1237626 RepID=W7A645_9APIC|nr:hypothetical protein C922_05096 [Plasmodium inui San Antonio 1]EUD64534.1 hypothetical protein C922_05096 [Plasmodium inui San Antonio 1]